mgnify:CR=1 FL=1
MKDQPVGIGPVLAGWVDGKPCYYVDLAYQDGTVERRVWEKRRNGADRPAKLAAIRHRIALANQLRPDDGVVLCHDAPSFSGLVRLVSRLRRGNEVATAA